jgi:hypothetical protein
MRSRLSFGVLTAALLAVAAVPALAAQGWLGVSTQQTDADLRRGLDLTRDGLLVSRVFADSPAERAGLKKGDVILRFDGQSVTEPEELRNAVREAGSGRTAKMEVWRLSAARTLEVKLAEVPTSEEDYYEVPVPPTPRTAPTPPAPPAQDRSRAPELQRNTPPTPPAPPAAPDGDTRVHRKVYVNGRQLSEDEINEKLKELGIEGMGDWHMWSDDHAPGSSMFYGGTRGRLGVRVEKLTPELGEALGVPTGKGVVVLEVIEDTPAQKAGVRAGDVIIEVAGHEVNDRDDLTKALNDEAGRVDIVLTRKGSRRTVQADLPEQKSFSWSRGPGRTFSMRIPEPRRAPRVYRYDAGPNDEGDAELREEMRQLKEELRELKQQLGDQEQQQLEKEKAKEPAKPKTPAPAPKKK